MADPGIQLPHDPGGKVKTALAAGVIGSAVFSEDGRYRSTLARRWNGAAEFDPFALWIGMNPSTADHAHNDPTVAREIGFTHRLGYRSYIKMNVFDYRATDPKRLLGLSPSEVASSGNLKRIIEIADLADIVVAAWGALPKALIGWADDLCAAMRAAEINMQCLGYTKSGAPRHPLYMPSNAVLQPYPRA